MATQPVEHLTTAYESDFAAWALDQAALLRAKRYSDVDWDNVIDEIESLARGEYRQLVAVLETLTASVLRYKAQIMFRSEHWRAMIEAERRHVRDQLDENPSLLARCDQALAEAYGGGRMIAVNELGVDFPEDCPFTWDSLMTGRLEP